MSYNDIQLINDGLESVFVEIMNEKGHTLWLVVFIGTQLTWTHSTLCTQTLLTFLTNSPLSKTQRPFFMILPVQCATAFASDVDVMSGMPDIDTS